MVRNAPALDAMIVNYITQSLFSHSDVDKRSITRLTPVAQQGTPRGPARCRALLD
jgi:hypothetical protein